MPLSEEFIDKLIFVNKQIEKSQITNLYFALPVFDNDKTGFEQLRVFYPKVTNFEYWEKIILYTKEKGFDFIYLLNSPRPLLYESSYLLKQLEKLDNLINKFRKLDIKKLRVVNIQLMDYIAKHYPDMELYLSTSTEYTSIKQIQNIMTLFPQIKQIVPSHDVNKNFKFLKSIKKQYPNVSIEIMLNEGCIAGCPARFWHAMSFPSTNSLQVDGIGEELKPAWFSNICCTKYKDTWEKICISNTIYPWEVNEYNKIGIYDFKMLGRSNSLFNDKNFYNYYLQYLKGIDDYKNIENYQFNYLIHHYHYLDMLFEEFKNYKVKDIRPYLPEIKHFIKNGHLCY